MKKKKIKNRKQKKLNRKAQIQMGESFAAVVIVIFLILFAMVFYNKVQTRKYDAKKAEVESFQAIEIAKTASFLPELQCSRDGIIDVGCIDIEKTIAFNESLAAMRASNDMSSLYYVHFFKDSKISIKQIYPATDEPEFVIYENNISAKKTKTFYMPVRIFNSSTDQNAFGILKVVVYS